MSGFTLWAQLVLRNTQHVGSWSDKCYADVMDNVTVVSFFNLYNSFPDPCDKCAVILWLNSSYRNN